MPIAWRDVGFDPQDRLDALLPREVVKRDRSVQIPMIRDGHRIHPELSHPINELIDPIPAIEQRILGVQVQVHKGFAR